MTVVFFPTVIGNFTLEEQTAIIIKLQYSTYVHDSNHKNNSLLVKNAYLYLHHNESSITFTMKLN